MGHREAYSSSNSGDFCLQVKKYGWSNFLIKRPVFMVKFRSLAFWDEMPKLLKAA
jgi:hypothetical protein